MPDKMLLGPTKIHISTALKSIHDGSIKPTREDLDEFFEFHCAYPRVDNLFECLALATTILNSRVSHLTYLVQPSFWWALKWQDRLYEALKSARLKSMAIPIYPYTRIF